MFRLIKLAAYVSLGYLLYEFYKGVTEQGQGLPERERYDRDLERALNEDQGRMMNMTGPGRGTMTDVAGSGGATSHELVGRGVVNP